jgi:hypothetical protein
MATPDQQAIDINPGDTPECSTFTPVTVTQADLVFWRNNTGLPHWLAPTRDPGDKNTWMSAEIPANRFDPRIPAPTSDATPIEETITYFCLLHDGETGDIVVKAEES